MKLFISYSRRDSDEADALVSALEGTGHEVLIDRRDLPFGEEWRAELREFIQAADSVVWLVSVDSIASRWCHWELAEVQRLNKRLIPVRLDDLDPDDLPGALGSIHTFPAVGAYRADEHFGQLCAVLDTNIEWLKLHTRLADRAREWIASDRAGDRLLRGEALKAAERWADRRPERAPAAPASVLELILISRQTSQRRGRLQLGAAVLVAGITSILAVIALVQGERAEQQAAASDRLRREAVAASVQTAEQRADLLTAIADRQQDPTAATLVALEAWSGAGGAFEGFAVLDEFIEQGGSEEDGDHVPLPLDATLDVTPDYAKVVSRVVRNVPEIRERAVFGDWEQGKFWAFMGASRRIAQMKEDGEGRIWSLDDSQDAVPFGVTGEEITDLTASPDGSLLAASGKSGHLYVWDSATGESLLVVRLEYASIGDLAFSPDGRWLAFAPDMPGIGLIALRRDGNGPERLSPHLDPRALVGLGGPAFTLAWSDQSDRLVASSSQGSVVIWNAQTGDVVQKIPLDRYPTAYDLAFSSDGTMIAAGMGFQHVAAWHIGTQDPIISENVERGSGTVQFSPDNSQLLYTLRNGEIVFHPLVDGARATRVRCGDGPIPSILSVPAQGMTIATTADSHLCAFGPDDREPLFEIVLDSRGQFDELEYDAITHDLVGLSYWGPARMYSLEPTIPEPDTWEKCGLRWDSLRFSPDGETLIGADNLLSDGNLCLWDAQTGSLVFELPDVKAARAISIFAAGGRQLLATADSRAVLVNLADGGYMPLPELAGVATRTAIFSDDLSMVIANGYQRGLGFSARGSGARFRRFGADSIGAVTYAAVNRQTGLLATVSDAGYVDVWNVASAARVLSFSREMFDVGPGLVEFSEDGRELRIMFDNGAAKRWGIEPAPEGRWRIDPDVDGQSWSPDEPLFGILPLRSNGVTVFDLGLDQPVGVLGESVGLPGAPIAASRKYIAEQQLSSGEGYDLVVHELPPIMSRFAAPRAVARFRVLDAAEPLPREEFEFWGLERQRHVYRQAVDVVPRCLSPIERSRIGLEPDPPCWCIDKPVPGLDEWIAEFGRNPFVEGRADGKVCPDMQGGSGSVDVPAPSGRLVQARLEDDPEPRFVAAYEKRDYSAAFAEHAGYLAASMFAFHDGTIDAAALAWVYGNHAWYGLFAGEYSAAENAARQGKELDSAQTWIDTNLAHALMLQGKQREALAVYDAYRGQPPAGNGDRSWEDIIAEDFDALRAAGHGSPLMNEVLARFAAP